MIRAAVAFSLAFMLLPASASAFVRTTTCEALCDNTCASAGDGICSDGGADSVSDDCAFGTDCADCGYRPESGTSIMHCREGETPIPIKWCAPCVGYYIQQGELSGIASDEELVGAIEASFETWNAVECNSLQAIYSGRTNEDRAGYAQCGSNVNFVGFVKQGWRQLGYPSSALAITSVTFDIRTGVIVDADMEINGENYEFDIMEGPSLITSAHDLQNVVTHEVGHFFGLDHAQPETHTGGGSFQDTTMAERSPAGDLNMRTLHPDDIAGVCEIYPLDRYLADAVCELPAFGFVEKPASVPGASCNDPNSVPQCEANVTKARGCSTTGHRSMPGPLVLLLAGLAIRRFRRA